MIDGSEKRNRQLAFELQNRILMFVKSAVKSSNILSDIPSAILTKASIEKPKINARGARAAQK